MEPTVLLLLLPVVLFLLYRLVASKPASPAAAAKKPALRCYPRSEVEKHNTESSMWIVVRYGASSRVYDITEYCDMHPGGDVIYDSAGKDATEKFNGPQHPPTVHDLIREYHIGWVEGEDGGEWEGEGGDGKKEA